MIYIDRLIFILGLFPLLYFSAKDIIKAQLSNKSIIFYATLSILCLLFFSNQVIQIIALGIVFFFIFSIVWVKGGLGGADLKIIPFIVVFLTIKSNNYIVTAWFFLLGLILISIPYYLTCILFLKKRKIPFIPILTLNYILIYSINYYMN